MSVWCKVVDGAVIVAPGGIADGETEADGWLPVVDVPPFPQPGQSGDVVLAVKPNRVERSWRDIVDTVPAVDPALAALRDAVATLTTAAPDDPVVAALRAIALALAPTAWQP